jgi:hypothetical protein
LSTYTWSIPEGKNITGTTFIKTTDNHIADTIDDLVDFVNGEGEHLSQGLTYDLIDRASTQTITGLKTFTSTINANVNGNVTGSLAGNATTASALQTARNINLIGDVSGSSSFDGSTNINISATVADDSHNHVMSNVDGLSTELATKQDNIVSGTHVKTVNGINIVGSGSATLPHATSTTYGTIKAYVSGNSLYITL